MISSPCVSRITLRRDKVESFGQYPFSLPVVRRLEQIELHPRDGMPQQVDGRVRATLRRRIALLPCHFPKHLPLGQCALQAAAAPSLPRPCPSTHLPSLPH